MILHRDRNLRAVRAERLDRDFRWIALQHHPPVDGPGRFRRGGGLERHAARARDPAHNPRDRERRIEQALRPCVKIIDARRGLRILDRAQRHERWELFRRERMRHPGHRLGIQVAGIEDDRMCRAGQVVVRLFHRALRRAQNHLKRWGQRLARGQQALDVRRKRRHRGSERLHERLVGERGALADHVIRRVGRIEVARLRIMILVFGVKPTLVVEIDPEGGERLIGIGDDSARQAAPERSVDHRHGRIADHRLTEQRVRQAQMRLVAPSLFAVDHRRKPGKIRYVQPRMAVVPVHIEIAEIARRALVGHPAPNHAGRRAAVRIGIRGDLLEFGIAQSKERFEAAGFKIPHRIGAVNLGRMAHKHGGSADLRRAGHRLSLQRLGLGNQCREPRQRGKLLEVVVIADRRRIAKPQFNGALQRGEGLPFVRPVRQRARQVVLPGRIFRQQRDALAADALHLFGPSRADALNQLLLKLHMAWKLLRHLKDGGVSLSRPHRHRQHPHRPPAHDSHVRPPSHQNFHHGFRARVCRSSHASTSSSP